MGATGSILAVMDITIITYHILSLRHRAAAAGPLWQLWQRSDIARARHDKAGTE